MVLEQEIVGLGGPKPIDVELLQNSTTSSPSPCKCGGNCDGNCGCSGECGGECGCKGKDLSIPEKASEAIKKALNETESTLKKASPKYVTNENLLKLSIALALGVAFYVYVKD